MSTAGLVAATSPKGSLIEIKISPRRKESLENGVYIVESHVSSKKELEEAASLNFSTFSHTNQEQYSESHANPSPTMNIEEQSINGKTGSKNPITPIDYNEFKKK